MCFRLIVFFLFQESPPTIVFKPISATNPPPIQTPPTLVFPANPNAVIHGGVQPPQRRPAAGDSGVQLVFKENIRIKNNRIKFKEITRMIASIKVKQNFLLI